VAEGSVLPRPIQKPALPIFMAAALTPESFVAAGQQGHSIMLAPFTQSRGTLKENVQLCKETESGHSPEGVEIVAGYHISVDETPELACSKWESNYLRYMHFVGSLINPEEYTRQQYQSWRQSGEALKRVT
jgi:alkanesulfonate monooxygenase SsuD/methylene tetrahydromethanopterin reductase-like flavin-dependent oxidoreductase (luciferase family)